VRDSEYPDVGFCVAKYPITNEQFRKFTEATHMESPAGQHFVPTHDDSRSRSGSWIGPFYPWENSAFNHPAQPAVCVSLSAANAYCAWVNTLAGEKKLPVTFLPSPQLWDYAAFGTPYPSRDPRIWLSLTKKRHNQASAPARTNEAGDRTNRFGVSDLIGNVWEWCELPPRPYGMLGPPKPAVASLRGGGFLDNLAEVEPFLDASLLVDGTDTSHSDLGFRVAGLVDVLTLPKSVRERLAACDSIPGLIRSIAAAAGWHGRILSAWDAKLALFRKYETLGQPGRS
jgi:formylglycine-generating enzyme required for sulfatase activity